MKVFRFKFIVTMLFLLVALFAAGFTAKASPRAFGQQEVAAVQRSAASDSLGGGFVLTYDAEGRIPA